LRLICADRKAKLVRLLAGAPAGIVFNEQTDEDGAVVFSGAANSAQNVAPNATTRRFFEQRQ